MSVYLITGGNGFVGKHILRLLLQYERDVREVRIYDRYIDDDFPTVSSRVVLIKGDITDYRTLLAACVGVDIIIHAASIIDVWYKISDDTIYDINVIGTRRVIDACVKCNVKCLVYTSSMEVIGPNNKGDPFIMGDEDTSYEIKHNMAYPKSKSQAEKLVLEADGKQLQNGCLRTCALRPTGIYGEGHELIKEFYKMCLERVGVMVSGIPESVKHSRVYVGNVAWMHILAARTLLKTPNLIGGQVFFCYDNTPCLNYDRFNMLLLSQFQFRLRHIPYGALWLLAAANDAIRKACKCFIYTPMLNRYTLSVAGTTFTVKSDKATRYFQYEPLYSWEQCLSRTQAWIDTFK
ncbi:3 beta-hydroxysteroid dehydrogenase [Scale drop disease virus]|uniref:3 beta-hydroxysteroid dehydrogenase n=1 Tax=Scale drop disease virus TaxID=1697349 RepID=A0A7D5UL71_9VIRU|nr:3 beta-hydroxysteroid dehydrogenase [Scale drop disease virus]QXJ13703.1 ORF113R [Scale drop disease virus]